MKRPSYNPLMLSTAEVCCHSQANYLSKPLDHIKYGKNLTTKETRKKNDELVLYKLQETINQRDV